MALFNSYLKYDTGSYWKWRIAIGAHTSTIEMSIKHHDRDSSYFASTLESDELQSPLSADSDKSLDICLLTASSGC